MNMNLSHSFLLIDFIEKIIGDLATAATKICVNPSASRQRFPAGVGFHLGSTKVRPVESEILLIEMVFGFFVGNMYVISYNLLQGDTYKL